MLTYKPELQHFDTLLSNSACVVFSFLLLSACIIIIIDFHKFEARELRKTIVDRHYRHV